MTAVGFFQWVVCLPQSAPPRRLGCSMCRASNPLDARSAPSPFYKTTQEPAPHSADGRL